MAIRWTVIGTLTDELQNTATTGYELTVSGASIFHLSDNWITDTYQLLEAHRELVPSQEVQDWLVREQGNSDLISNEALARGWGKWWCRMCGCCLPPGNERPELS